MAADPVDVFDVAKLPDGTTLFVPGGSVLREATTDASAAPPRGRSPIPFTAEHKARLSQLAGLPETKYEFASSTPNPLDGSIRYEVRLVVPKRALLDAHLARLSLLPDAVHETGSVGDPRAEPLDASGTLVSVDGHRVPVRDLRLDLMRGDFSVSGTASDADPSHR